MPKSRVTHPLALLAAVACHLALPTLEQLHLLISLHTTLPAVRTTPWWGGADSSARAGQEQHTSSNCDRRLCALVMYLLALAPKHVSAVESMKYSALASHFPCWTEVASTDTKLYEE
jgi:hypothetical protein